MSFCRYAEVVYLYIFVRCVGAVHMCVLGGVLGGAHVCLCRCSGSVHMCVCAGVLVWCTYVIVQVGWDSAHVCLCRCVEVVHMCICPGVLGSAHVFV